MGKPSDDSRPLMRLAAPDAKALDPELVQDIHALAIRSRNRPEVQACYGVLEPLLGEGDAEPLAEYLRLALLGLATAFVERNLSPYLDQHRAIVAPLLEDIRGVYAQVVLHEAPYSPDEFRYRDYREP